MATTKLSQRGVCVLSPLRGYSKRSGPVQRLEVQSDFDGSAQVGAESRRRSLSELSGHQRAVLASSEDSGTVEVEPLLFPSPSRSDSVREGFLSEECEVSLLFRFSKTASTDSCHSPVDHLPDTNLPR